MKSKFLTRVASVFAAVLFLVLPVTSQQNPQSVIMTALEQELQRAQKIPKEKGDPAPYLISYQVYDQDQTVITAQYGALQNSESYRTRLLDADVRVGDYQLDNTHRVGGGGNFAGGNGAIPISTENDLDALKSSIWMVTDQKYKSAQERLMQIKTDQAIKVEEEDKSADLSREAPQKAVIPTPSTGNLDKSAWEKRVRNLSAFFNKTPEILSSNVSFNVEKTTKYLVNSEGTAIEHGTTHARITVYARTKAEDGMELYRFETFDAFTPAGLPGDDKVKAAMDKMTADLIALRKAPVIEPYTGPAILSGRASGVFFHEIFGHRIEGHRQKEEDSGQTFTKQVNKQILPEFISVYDDPTLKQMGGVDLNGYFQFDDEGVIAQRVQVVENGVLKNFLMSRSPIKSFPKSNGHGRKQPGMRPVGRQGNLIVKASQTVSEAQLRELLIAECKKQSKPFGLIFQDISGGFTTTQRNAPQAFQVTPVMVYRVYADGRPDELVRGVDLIGTPLTSFSKIVAASDTTEVFNGVCGAESGWVPVSAVSPSILTTQIEVQKKPKSSERLPILPPPAAEPSK